MARRPRIDSTAEQVRIMAAAAKAILPPASVPLDADELIFFTKLVEEFARSELTDHKLELVAFAARTMQALKREQEALQAEGSVLEGEKGSYANPRVAFVKNYLQSIINLRRSLALHGRARDGDTEVVVKRRKEAKAIERESPLVDEELLARANRWPEKRAARRSSASLKPTATCRKVPTLVSR